MYLRQTVVIPWVALAAVFAGLLPSVAIAQRDEKLQLVAEFPKQQVTGVTVAEDGRVFVNFPYWSDPHGVSVGLLVPGQPIVPYPDTAWNRNDGPPGERFVCVQSVVADHRGSLWVLDPASVKMAGIAPGGPKLVRIDLATNSITRVYLFPPDIAPAKSYLNDVRIDWEHEKAIITDSGLGALVVVDLESGESRRVLADDPSTKAEPNLTLNVEGVLLIDPQTRQPVQIHVDGIALDQADSYLYYKALTGHTLYRIQLADLEDPEISAADLGHKVETVATTPTSDGLFYRPGFIYITAIEQDAVVRLNLQNKQLEVVAKDERLKWPDTLSFGPDGSLYVTNSEIHLMPWFNNGQSKFDEPFGLYRIAADKLR